MEAIMAEIVRDEDARQPANWLSVAALVVAAAALVLALVAYNRAGEDLSQQISDEVNSALDAGTDTIEDGADATGETIQDAANSIESETDNDSDGVNETTR
jgi:hypothetical protein